MNFKKEKRVMLRASKQASKVILRHYGKKGAVKEKPNRSFAATADIEANKIIINTIKKSFPKHSILSEETGFEDNKSEYKWVIDPVDGTHNFLHSLPFFGTSIALEYKNKAVLGVLDFPLLRITAVAEKGRGAFLNGKKMKVSGKKNLGHSCILFEISYSGRKQKLRFLERLADRPIDLRSFGCAIYNLLLVASGRSDCFVIFSTNEWDVAAGFLMVEEAGGKITDLCGREWGFQGRQYIVSNSRLHAELLKLVGTKAPAI